MKKKKMIQNMNSKMAINAYLSTTESNNKLNEQAEQKQTHR